MNINWTLLIGFVVLCNLIGAIGGLWAGGDSGWYKNLNKPRVNPPSWVFGPVWTILFTLMGIALYFVWISPASNLRTIGLVLFGLQFVLNILWSYLFFGLQNPLLGFIEIIVLELFIVATGIMFYFIRPLAGYLFIPYFLWVDFAAFLTWRILKLN